MDSQTSVRKLLHAELLEKRLTPSEAFSVKKHPIILIVDSIRSAYNIGSMFRTADSAGIQEIALCGYSPYPPREDISKTALGADETVQWKYFTTAQEAVEHYRKAGFTVLAVELTDNSKDYTKVMPEEFPLALVVGNEISGIDENVLSLCHGAIEIPMYGVKHSLNVAVATGIVLYEMVRIWRNSQQQ